MKPETEQTSTPRKRKQPQRPPTGNGKTERTAAQLYRQEQVFIKRVIECKTVREVAAEMGLSLDTVVKDCRAELVRRSQELGERREDEKTAHVAMVEDLYRKSVGMIAVPGTGASGAAAKALEMRAKLLGLDAPTKIDIGLQGLVNALDG